MPAGTVGAPRAERIALIGAVALAAALRFTELGARGWWRDEAVTVRLLRLPFDELLRTIPNSEGTPPLYYVVAWGWTRLFGDSEAGLRSLSALLGTITVVVVYLAGRELVSGRTGLMAAYFAAASPLLVWHSQDGRAYSLLVLLGALSFLFFVRLDRTASWVDALCFALASALALLSHYFAVFLVLPGAVWLLVRPRARRVAAIPVAVVAVVGLSLIPLVAAQRGNVSWISEVPRYRRLLEVAQEFLVGPQPPWERLTTVVAGVLGAVAIVLVVLRRRRDLWPRIGPALAIGLAALAVPLVLAFAGFDYVLARNLIVAWVPLMICVAAGLTAPRAGRTGLALAAVLVALGIGVVVGSASTPKFGAEDWRGAARALGPPPAGGRVIVLWPDAGREPFLVYRPEARDLPARGASASEVVLLTFGARRRDDEILEGLSPTRPFEESERQDEPYFTLIRFDTKEPVALTPMSLASSWLGPRPTVLDER
jgi:mannosyltransferase